LKTLKKVYSEICCVGGVDKWQNKTDIQADNAFISSFCCFCYRNANFTFSVLI